MHWTRRPPLPPVCQPIDAMTAIHHPRLLKRPGVADKPRGRERAGVQRAWRKVRSEVPTLRSKVLTEVRKGRRGMKRRESSEKRPHLQF